MRDDADRPLPVMPWWVVTLGLAGAVVAGVAVIWWLLGDATTGDAGRAALRIDAIRTGLTVVAGTGGAVALVFAARRQWLAERAQRHRERVDAADRAHADRVQAHQEQRTRAEREHDERVAAEAERDATERRITDLFAKAVDQLGAGTAAARLGGLYALERLAQTYPAHRQTIVDMICGYLRMPAVADDPQEPQVRRTAQRVLCRHLVPDADTYWPGVAIDLSGAVLVEFDARDCTIARADFAGTRFDGVTLFDAATFDGYLTMAGARFTGVASFQYTTFRQALELAGVAFEPGVDFASAAFEGGVYGAGQCRFGGWVSFTKARFADTAEFDRARVPESTDFDYAEFAAGASFDHTEFGAGLTFHDTRFAGTASLRFLTVREDAVFTGARFDGPVNLSRSRFHGSVTFDRVTLGAAAYLDGTRAAVDGTRAWPAGLVESSPRDGWVSVAPEHPGPDGELVSSSPARTG